MVAVIKKTNEPDEFEKYNNLDRGVKIYMYPDFEKILLEFKNKKHFVRFRSFEQEITKKQFEYLFELWENGKNFTSKVKQKQLQEIDMTYLLALRNKYVNS